MTARERLRQYPRVASLKTADAFRSHLDACGASLAFDDTLDPPGASPLAQPFELDGVRVGNRFCILPMEGWDGTADGQPSDLTRRRWQRFGISGAKLIWGGEAVAVQHDGRANPHQLVLTAATQPAIAGLRDTLVAAHRERFGANADADLYIGLQLTHSGRYSRAGRPYDAGAAGRLRAPGARPALPRRRADPDRRRSRSPGRAIRRRGADGRGTPGSRSSTSSTATAISGTSC